MRLKNRMAGWMKSKDQGWIQVDDSKFQTINYKERDQQQKEQALNEWHCPNCNLVNPMDEKYCEDCATDNPLQFGKMKI